MAERLTPRSPELEVRGSSPARRVASLDKELYSTLSLFAQVYKWVPASYCWGITLRWTTSRPGGRSNTPRHASAKETGISFGRLGLWLVCAFVFLCNSLIN